MSKDIINKIEKCSSNYFRESEIEEKLKMVIIPYLDKHIESGYFKGNNNENIYYEKYILPESKGSIVISHGFTESLEKYHELIYYFLNENYDVYGLEHRGHARSGSLVNTNISDKSQVNIDKFEYYVDDIKIFLDKSNILKNNDKPSFLFAHSMGGAIGAIFLEKYQSYFNAAILNAPMMEIETGKTPIFMAKLIANIMVMMGKGDKYVLGHGPFRINPDLDSSATSSYSRYINYHNFMIKNKEYQRSGASFNWLKNAFKATKSIENYAYKIEIPILLCQAGEDTYVRSRGHNKFLSKVKNATLKVYKDSKHEIYWEKDDIMFNYLDDILDFYNRQIKKIEPNNCDIY